MSSNFTPDSCCVILISMLSLIMAIPLIIIGGLDIANLQNCPDNYETCIMDITSSGDINVVRTIPVICITDFQTLPSVTSGNQLYTCTTYKYQVCNNFCYTNASYTNPIPNPHTVQKGLAELISGLVFFVLFLIFLVYAIRLSAQEDARIKEITKNNKGSERPEKYESSGSQSISQV